MVLVWGFHCSSFLVHRRASYFQLAMYLWGLLEPALYIWIPGLKEPCQMLFSFDSCLSKIKSISEGLIAALPELLTVSDLSDLLWKSKHRFCPQRVWEGHSCFLGFVSERSCGVMRSGWWPTEGTRSEVLKDPSNVQNASWCWVPNVSTRSRCSIQLQTIFFQSFCYLFINPFWNRSGQCWQAHSSSDHSEVLSLSLLRANWPFLKAFHV